MLITTPNDYWLSSTALHIELNALGQPNYIQASCASGAQILVYIKDIIGYDAGHNYQRWSLQASPTVFNSNTEKYVYAAIPRPVPSSEAMPQSNALIVFPSELIDIYGKNAAEEQIGSEDYYYIFLNGVISATNEAATQDRTWNQTIITGYLSSDEAVAAGPTESVWYQYSSVDGVVTFLKDLTVKAGKKFLQLFARSLTIVTGGALSFEQGGSLVGVADNGTEHTSDAHIATPAYVDFAALSKRHDDTAEGDITFKGNVDVFGNLVAETSTHLKGNVTIGTSPSLPADMQHWGKSEWGTFIKGIITGSGAQIDIHGNAELESLVIRRFLEVPELRYNRVSVHSGTDWFTKGSGLIETVSLKDDTHGTITLHLEEGEFGTVAVNDYCMGIFHNLDGNATENVDDHMGVLQYQGFTTVYFLITNVSGDHNEILTYELRPVSEEWTGQTHPQPQMTFACYANPNDTSRQSAVLRTTDYTVYLENLTNWTFGPDNYYLIFGQLEGFAVWALNQKGARYLKQLHGNGTMLGNVYQFGSTDQFDRLADHVEVTAYPAVNADFSLAEGEVMSLNAVMMSFDDQPRADASFRIVRNSGNQNLDRLWNRQRGADISSGSIFLTISDLGSGPVTQFTITATRSIPKDDTTEEYSVSRDIVVRNAGGYTVSHNNPDPFMTLEEPKHFEFTVMDARGNDVTNTITEWSIVRHSSDATADAAWQRRAKVRGFVGSIDLVSSDDPDIDDLDPNDPLAATTFIITAANDALHLQIEV